MKLSRTASALILAVSLPLTGYSDDQPEAAPVPVGSRVRIETKDGRWLVGRVASWEDSGVTVVEAKSSESIVLDRASIVTMDRSTGTRSQMGKGALFGALAGVALPLLAGSGCSRCDVGSEEFLSALGPYTITIGTLLGGAIGSGISTDVWERVDGEGKRPVALGVTLSPAPGMGIGAGLRLSWK